MLVEWEAPVSDAASSESKRTSMAELARTRLARQMETFSCIFARSP